MFDLTREDLQHVVTGLSMLPVAADLHRRLSAKLHLETIAPTPTDCRRVTWISFRDGVETWCEFYGEAACDRIDQAIEQAWRTPVVAALEPQRSLLDSIEETA